MKEAAENAGAPTDLILCMDTVTLEGSKELMADKNIAIILATGGLGMVKAAHSLGNLQLESVLAMYQYMLTAVLTWKKQPKI